MYLANLTQPQYLDFHLLDTLAKARTTIIELSESTLTFSAEEKIPVSLLAAKTVGEAVPMLPAANKLLVSGEALNLEKLHKVRVALEQLEIGYWQISDSRTGKGAVAKASVQTPADEAIKAQIADISEALHLEIALTTQAPKLHMGGLMVMDMDSTLIAVECIDEIAKLAGLGDKVAEITELAMQGKLDFKESLYNRVACLAGVDVSLLEGIRDRLPLMPGLSNLVNTLQQQGWKIAIASGGFTFFADYLKDRLNFCYAISNVLEVVDGKLTGKVVGGVVDANVKAQTLQRLAQEYAVPAAQTIAVGDGANDLVMMAEAAFGVAYHAKPIVAQKALVAVRFGGLDTMLDYLD